MILVEMIKAFIQMFRKPLKPIIKPVDVTGKPVKPVTEKPVQPEVEKPAEPSIEIITRPMEENQFEFLQNIHQMPLDRDEYLQEIFEKKQIYLHHTAGNASAKAVVRNWNDDDRGRIATCVVISNKGAKDSFDGEIVQAFSSKYWGYHLGVKNQHFKNIGLPYISLDRGSIGVELCAWGPLKKKGDKFFNYVSGEVPADEVCELAEPFKGHKYYHKYSDAQIESLKNLLLYWNEMYDIPLTYNDDIWDITERAYKLEAGVFTHNSVRPDKTDVFPQPELIEMLKSIA